MYDNLAINNYAPTTGVAAVRNNGTDWKVVYVAFRPEALRGTTMRDHLIDLSIDWFDGVVSSPDFDNQIAGSVIKLYPNPATAEINLELSDAPAASKVNVYDMLGRVVISENVAAGNSSVKLNTTALDAGTYFLRLEGSKTFETKKIVIVK